MKAPRVELVFPELWPHQREFVDDEAQFTVCKSATKCGKTMAAAWWLAREAARNAGGMFWWVGPTNEVGLLGYRTVEHLLDPIIIRRQERPWKFKTEGGSTVALKTAQEPEFLRGAGVLAMVLDEAGAPDYDRAWPEIRTTITERRGRLKIIGNPGDGGSFFDKAENWGLDPGMPEWSFRRWKFLDRPTAKPEDFEQAKRELGEDSAEFRRYFLGETIRGEGVFFYNLDKAAVGELEEPIKGERYTIGVDPSGSGANADYLVASVFRDSQRRQVFYSRHKGAPTEFQQDEIVRLAGEYNDATVMIEVNGPGGPIYQNVFGRGVFAIPFNTQQKSKTEILYDYRADLSQGRAVILNDAYQIREHLQFQKRRTNFGNERLTAPSGGHDDMVMANAIALHALRQVIHPEIVWV